MNIKDFLSREELENGINNYFYKGKFKISDDFKKSLQKIEGMRLRNIPGVVSVDDDKVDVSKYVSAIETFGQQLCIKSFKSLFYET